MHRLNQRGYLGSIGDDLPSLIPITFALLIFFASLNFTFNQFEQKQIKFDQKLLTLKIASTLKGDSLLNDYAQFKTACTTVSSTGFKFKAGIYNIVDESGEPLSIHIYKDTPGEDKATLLQAKDSGGFLRDLECPHPPASDEPLYFSSLASQQPENLLYPIAVNSDGIIKSAMLVVTVWR